MRQREPVFGAVLCFNIIYGCFLAGSMAWKDHQSVWGGFLVFSFAVTAIAACRSIYRDRIA